MRARFPILAVTATVAACSTGPAPLGYSLPTETRVAYSYGDTTTVLASMMGRSMEIAMVGDAEYGVTFGPADEGLSVTLLVNRLAGSVSMPMAPPQSFGGSDVSGALVFSMDPRGNVTVRERPEVSGTAGRMISSVTTAHTFFPGLPGRVVAVGDQWVDTVSYGGDAELGEVTERSVMEYTVLGDSAVDGRDLLKIRLVGTTELSNEMELQGMKIAQSSTVDVEGWVLWDLERRLMVALTREGSGTGAVRVPMLPQPLPIEVRVTQRARLQR